MKTVNNPRGTAIAALGLTFAPLSLGALEKYLPRLQQLEQDGQMDFALVIDLALSSLQRNYPEITREAVGDLLDLGILPEVMQAILGASGLTRDAGGQEQGESTGGSSTAT